MIKEFWNSIVLLNQINAFKWTQKELLNFKSLQLGWEGDNWSMGNWNVVSFGA